MSVFAEWLVEFALRLWREGIIQGAVVSRYDPETRGGSEALAAQVRIFLEERGILFDDPEKLKLAERRLSYIRAILERLVNERVDSGTFIVFLEKLLADSPDFMSNVLFATPEAFEMWLDTHGGREAFKGFVYLLLGEISDRFIPGALTMLRRLKKGFF